MIRDKQFRAFRGSESTSYLERSKENALKRITDNSDEREVEQVIDTYTQKPIIFHEDKINQKLCKDDLLIFLPYEGDKAFLSMKPKNWSTYTPLISSEENNEIIFMIENVSKINTEEIGKRIKRDIEALKYHCKNLKKEVDEYNSELKIILKEKYKTLKEKTKTIEEKIKDLGIPERK